MATPRTALVIGASKNLGLGLAAELAGRGWDVIGTVRGAGKTGLHVLAESLAGGVRILEADITVVDDILNLREELGGAQLDLLFVNAGITDEDVPIGEVSTEVFTRVMVTNALSPLRVIETLGGLVTPGGTIAVMSSRQGSIGFNTRGGHELYRASKSALNQLMRSYSARQPERSLMLIHPGWVQTDLGGIGAPLTVDNSVSGIVDVLERHAGEPGLQFRDFQDEVVPW